MTIVAPVLPQRTARRLLVSWTIAYVLAMNVGTVEALSTADGGAAAEAAAEADARVTGASAPTILRFMLL